MGTVTQVVPRDDFQLEPVFGTGETRLFDARPYLNRGGFRSIEGRGVVPAGLRGLRHDVLAGRVGHRY